MRNKYINTMFDLLNPGGELVGIFLPLDKDLNPEGFFTLDELPAKKGRSGYGRKMIVKCIEDHKGHVVMKKTAYKKFGFYIYLPLLKENKQR